MSLGVRIYEDTKATALDKDGVGVLITTPLGRVRAGKVALGNQRVQAAAEADQPLHRPGLRLLHGHRAAVERRSSPTSAGRTARASATSPTSSTTTG